MTKALMNIKNGKIIACLEGGYNLKSIAWSTEAVINGLLNEEMPELKSIF